MAVRKIKTYPEKILGKKAEPVKTIDGEVQDLIDDMIETMYSAAGIGLAAPQVGVSKRVIVVDISAREEEDTPLIALINPEIIRVEGEIEGQEGCLSLPEFISTIARAERVWVQGTSREGAHLDIKGEGLLARALQHEIDHLNGILIIDRASSIKREFYKKKFKKALARV